MSDFDAASAAVQAALDAGASYADARVMHRRTESMDARNGEIEELNQVEDAGVGVRALVGSGWGFFAVPDLSDAAARGAGARAAAIAAASATVPGSRSGTDPGSGGQRQLGLGLRGRPAGRTTQRQGRPAGVAHRDHARRRSRPGRGQLQHLGHAQVVRLQRGPPHRPAHPRVRCRNLRHRDRRRRDPAPVVPVVPRPVRHPRLGAGRRARPGRPRRTDRRGGTGAADGPAVPVRRDHTDPWQRADGAADPRVGRARDRARPHPRLGGGVRRHVLAGPRHSWAPCGTGPS